MLVGCWGGGTGFREQEGTKVGADRSRNTVVNRKDGTRAEVVEKYRTWFLKRVTKDPAFCRKVGELAGEALLCFCAPLPCHGDVLKWWLENE